MKKHKKIIAVFMVVVLLLQVVTIIVAAEDTSSKPYEYNIPKEIISDENIETYGHVSRSFESEEALNQICLVNENGTNTMYMFDYPVKYIDTDDGVIKDKSNKLHNSNRNNYLYVNEENDIKTYFPKKIIKKPVITEVQGYKIEIGIVTDSKYAKKGELIGENYVFYNQAFGEDTAIGYTTDFNGYKEEIIVYSPNAPTEYSFEIYCEGLEAINNNGVLEFFDENTKEKIFSTDPFYIYDSSDEVKSYIETNYELIKNDDHSYLLSIALNEQYISSGVTYPIYIDPAVKYNNTQYIKNAPIYSGNPDTNYSNATAGYVGRYNSTYGVGRMLFSFPELINSSTLFQTLPENQIISVQLNIYNYAMGTQDSTLSLHATYGVENWYEDSVTWNMINPTSYGATIASGLVSSSTSSYCYFDITPIALTWRGVGNPPAYDSCQRGVLLKNSNETSSAYVKSIRTIKFSSSYAPYVTLNYSEQVLDGTYYIQNVRTKMFADHEGFSPTEGTKVELKNFNSLANGEWRIEKRLDGYYSIVDTENGYYLGVNNNSGANNASIVYLEDDNADGAKWTFSFSSSGNYVITAKSTGATGRVLSVPDTAPTQGSDLIQFSYTDDDNYKDEWVLYNISNDITEFLPYWNSDDEYVAYFRGEAKYYVDIGTYEADGFGNLGDLVETAEEIWEAAVGVTLTRVYNAELADIVIYGADSENFSNETGFTDRYGNTTVSHRFSAKVIAKTKIKEIREIDNVIMHILYTSEIANISTNLVQNTVIHELGHAIGWLGHSNTPRDIMSEGRDLYNTLSDADILHLKQVYDLMR